MLSPPLPAGTSSRQGCNAPTLLLPDSSLSYPGRLAFTWLPLNQSKPGQTSSKRPLSFLASEALHPDPAKEPAAAVRPGDPVSLGSGVSLHHVLILTTLYLLGPWWVPSLNMGIPHTGFSLGFLGGMGSQARSSPSWDLRSIIPGLGRLQELHSNVSAQGTCTAKACSRHCQDWCGHSDRKGPASPAGLPQSSQAPRDTVATGELTSGFRVPQIVIRPKGHHLGEPCVETGKKVTPAHTWPRRAVYCP